jgi:hypothetical protein
MPTRRGGRKSRFEPRLFRYKRDLQLHPELLAFASICNEAASRYGDDWYAIEGHIKTVLHAMPKERRERLAREMDRVLRYIVPNRDAETQ